MSEDDLFARFNAKSMFDRKNVLERFGKVPRPREPDIKPNWTHSPSVAPGLATGPAQIHIVGFTEETKKRGFLYRNEAQKMLGLAQSLASPDVDMTGLQRTYHDGTFVKVTQGPAGLIATIIPSPHPLPPGIKDAPKPGEPGYEAWQMKFAQTDPFMWVGVRLTDSYSVPFPTVPIVQAAGDCLAVWEPGAPFYTSTDNASPWSDPDRVRDVLWYYPWCAFDIINSGGRAPRAPCVSQSGPMWGEPDFMATQSGNALYTPDKCLGRFWTQHDMYMEMSTFAIEISEDDPSLPASDFRVVSSYDAEMNAYPNWAPPRPTDPTNPDSEWDQIVVMDPREHGSLPATSFTIDNKLGYIYTPHFNPYTRRRPRLYDWVPGVEAIAQNPHSTHEDDYTAPWRPARFIPGNYLIKPFHGTPPNFFNNNPGVIPSLELMIVSGAGPGQTVARFRTRPMVYGPNAFQWAERTYFCNCVGGVGALRDNSIPNRDAGVQRSV